MDLKCPSIAVYERNALQRKLQPHHLSAAKLGQRRSLLRPPALRRCAYLGWFCVALRIRHQACGVLIVRTLRLVARQPQNGPEMPERRRV
jgi:hypothetical protein